jgi:hypothetical protein
MGWRTLKANATRAWAENFPATGEEVAIAVSVKELVMLLANRENNLTEVRDGG